MNNLDRAVIIDDEDISSTNRPSEKRRAHVALSFPLTTSLFKQLAEGKASGKKTSLEDAWISQKEFEKFKSTECFPFGASLYTTTDGVSVALSRTKGDITKYVINEKDMEGTVLKSMLEYYIPDWYNTDDMKVRKISMLIQFCRFAASRFCATSAQFEEVLHATNISNGDVKSIVKRRLEEQEARKQVTVELAAAMKNKQLSDLVAEKDSINDDL
eukprot:scaffold11520_cov106-Amphora_coffeaeformis.AAC.3